MAVKILVGGGGGGGREGTVFDDGLVWCGDQSRGGAPLVGPVIEDAEVLVNDAIPLRSSWVSRLAPQFIHGQAN